MGLGQLIQSNILLKTDFFDSLKELCGGSFLIRPPGRKGRQGSQNAKEEENGDRDEEKTEKHISSMAAARPAQKQNQKGCQPDGQQQKKRTVLRVCTGDIAADQRKQHSGCAAAAAVKTAQPINDTWHRPSPRFLVSYAKSDVSNLSPPKSALFRNISVGHTAAEPDMPRH